MKKIISCLLVLSMALCLYIPALAADFSDVKDSAWYAEAVDYVTENDLMDAESAHTFSPNKEAPRYVTIDALWRLAGKPTAEKNAAFPDVTDTDPYKAAVDWSVEAGVINGYTDGRFHGEDLVTREQFAAMLWRAVGKPDVTETVSFEDGTAISSYAITAAAWSQANGIVTGMPGNLFAPKGNITRAMVATILMRYAKLTLPADTKPKVLVAYFSYTGGTEKIAGYVKESLNAELYQIVPAVPYTDDILRYYDASTRAYIEQDDNSARPEISGSMTEIDDYDIIFVGYPIWYGKAPKIIYTFLESYDFSDKTIVPFCTSGSSGINNSELRSCASSANWINGARFSSGASRESIVSWINGLGLPVSAE